jgi:hypothetical protein
VGRVQVRLSHKYYHQVQTGVYLSGNAVYRSEPSLLSDGDNPPRAADAAKCGAFATAIVVGEVCSRQEFK